MKKQLLLLSSAMLLLCACSPSTPSAGSSSSSDSSSSPSSSSTPVTPDVTSSSESSAEPIEPAKIDVTIKVTASGISEYSGTHSKLYINSNFETRDWNTHPMTQDETNQNVWTYVFSQIEVDALYRFNIYYGDDTQPDWSNGLNAEGTSEKPIKLTVTEDQTLYEFNSTFTVPTTSHTFTLVLTPHIQSTEDTDDTMYASTYLWMWCSPDNTVGLTKQDDGTWTYEVSGYVGDKFQFTPCLGSESAINWSYQHGKYEDGAWAEWKSIEIDLSEDKESYAYDIYFKAQPDEIVGATYSVTWHYYATSWDNLGSEISVVYTVNGGTAIWSKMSWDKQTGYNYTATGADIPSGATVKYRLYSWKAENDERYLAADATGTYFSITVSSNLEYILTGDFGTSDSRYGVGTPTIVE